MRMIVFQRALILWFGLFAIGFANGTLRELTIRRIIQEPWAHHLSALTAALFFSTYVFLLWQKTKITSFNEALLVGALWLVLTVLTETFVLNRWISGLTWNEIIQTYNISRGELWPLVLLWVGILPILAYVFRGSTS